MFLFIDCGFMSYKTHVHLLNQHNSLLYWAVGGRYRQIFTERRRWDYSSEVNCVKAVLVWSPRRAPLPSNNGASAQTPTLWFSGEHFCQDQAHILEKFASKWCKGCIVVCWTVRILVCQKAQKSLDIHSEVKCFLCLHTLAGDCDLSPPFPTHL